MLNRAGRKRIVLVFVVQPLWSLPLGVLFLCKWLTTNEPNRSYPCTSGSSHAPATCLSGEIANMILGLSFTAIGTVFLIILLVMVRSWRRRDAVEDRLRGVRVRADGRRF
ncbi:hypothetical protein [Streptomyces sp. NPDC048419]|uniref:hypothetical protein n=1 Tax=Streptomyces sp. NPDC048419 TaxID=3365547 RepID=UPI00371F8BF3